MHRQDVDARDKPGHDELDAKIRSHHANLSEAAGQAYATRTLARNSSTAPRSLPDWLSSSRAFKSTPEAALPVAAAAVVTPPIWALISFDPAATCWMLRAISRVALPC